MLNLILIHRTAVGYEIFQEHSEFWNVPLAIAQLIKMLSLGIIRNGHKLHIEGPARGDDPQVFVEDDQRFPDSVHHRLRERTSVFDLAELFSKHGWPFSPCATFQITQDKLKAVRSWRSTT
jgi:hypothetical protein